MTTQRPLSKKDERKQRSHEAILDSAMKLLRRRGISASSVGDVMRGAGLTVGGFYGHFASKEALFTATIHRSARAMWDRLLEHANTATHPVAAAARAYLSRAHRDTPEAGCLLPSCAADIAEAGEPYRGALVEELERFATTLAPMLAAGTKRDKRSQALALVALFHGALSLARATNGTPFSDEILRAARELAEQLETSA